MKLITLFVLMGITFQSFSQISVGPKHTGKPGKFRDGEFDKFKNTETIFVLSNTLKKDVYEKILKDSWTVTPFQVVESDQFNIANYLTKGYSIAQLGGYKKNVSIGNTSSTYLYLYVDFIIYDSEAILKKLEKLSPQKRLKQANDIFEKNSSVIARFFLYPTDDFVLTAMSEKMDHIVTSLFNADIFYNYSPGMLKNYFQKVNQLIKNNQIYWMYGSDYLPELQKLASSKLYIPAYMTIKHSGWTGQDSEEDDENIHDIFKKYNYKYEIIPDNELSDRIMNNEDFYYLRYVRENAERFLQVVNAKTGEIVYRNYMTGLAYKIKAKHIADLNDKIKKAAKKKK